MKSADLEEFAKEINEMAPEAAYKYVNARMSDEAWNAIDKCLQLEGVTPESLAHLICDRFKTAGVTITFFTKALEHRKWLIDVLKDVPDDEGSGHE